MSGRRQKMLTRIGLLILGFCAVSQAQTGRILILDDFESPAGPARNWEGNVLISRDRASHGAQSALVRFEAGRSQISATRFPQDWREYDRLLFDIYCDRDSMPMAALRIYDSGDAGNAVQDDDNYFDARGKILLQKGWNHIQVRLHSLRVASDLRELSLEHIRRLVISAERGRLPWTFYLDNVRLAAGPEGRQSASRARPEEPVTVIDNGRFTLGQGERAEDVPESAPVAALRKEAQSQTDLLRDTIRAAQLQGIDTIYQERHLVTADLGLKIRTRLPWYNNDEKKREMFSYVAESCRRGRRELEDTMQGIVRLPEADDTQVREPLIRPLPRLKGRPIRGSYFLDDHNEPLMVVSLHSASHVLQRFFASPFQHIESYSVGGGSRWSIYDSPVYTAFQQWPDTHRVGWDGWCGHLVRDVNSMAGKKRENIVICLESPHIKEAVQEYIRTNIPKFHANPELLYDIEAYELMYICYCDRSQKMFREWLEKKYGAVERANEKWSTTYKSFSEVAAPPVKDSRPLPGTNRALWYDWARFNQDRFTDYLLWVRSLIREIDPHTPLAAGGSSSMLAGRTGTTGIDEERIVNELDDVILHEGGESTLGLDLQLALSEKKKPLADPEMYLDSVQYLLPHFLHGKSVAQIFHWPAQPSSELHGLTASSLAHSWKYPLAGVGELMRSALDVRRLNKEIAAFGEAPAEVAILYSQTATLQLPPEMLTWQTTPYLAALEKTYTASQFLDAKVTFVTERQIAKGWLSRYKLVLVPGVRNIPSEIFSRLSAYASQGGRVLVMPESFLGDEYNRPVDYLARLGITVRETRRPKPGGLGVMVQGYDQSFSQAATFADDAPQRLIPGDADGFGVIEELKTGGVRQVIAVKEGAKILARYSSGGPAIVQAPAGKGFIYYSGSELEEHSYARLLESLFHEAGVARPVRVRRMERDSRNIEARFAPLGSRKLLYVVNYNSEPARLKVDIVTGSIRYLLELREGKEIRGAEIEVPANQTAIYEIF
ncbi:MAG: beta-galactosidase [Bryobacteraceae bacterium]